MRFLFYSHDGLGLGHTRRHCAIAAALVDLAPQSAVLLASGVDEVNRLGLPSNVEVLKLPSLRKLHNGRYISRRMPVEERHIRSLRAELLLTTVRSFRPTVVLVDKHPLGASGEFRRPIKYLHEHGAKAVLGLRDVLDEPRAILKEWAEYRIRELMEKYYDLVLVYGHPAVFDPVKDYDLSPALAKRTRMCGYVVHVEARKIETSTSEVVFARRNGKPLVLATTGGGEDGFFLLEKFIRASQDAPWQGAVIAGPMTPEHEFKTLERLAAPADVVLRKFTPNLSGLLGSIDALVCMGGYNTLAEAVSNGVPILCVPRTAPRKEQLIRAKAFERLGLLRVIAPDSLNVGNLHEAVLTTLKDCRRQLLTRAHSALSFEGAREAANYLLALAASTKSSKAGSLRRPEHELSA